MGLPEIFAVLLVAGVLLIGAEVFLPGAIMGIVGALCLIGAMVTGYMAFPAAGPFIIVGIFGFAIAVIALWITIFPRTSVGRQMTVSTDLATSKSADPRNAALLDKEGRTLSELRPGGFATIDGRRVDVVTRGEMIQRDEPVKVIKVEGIRVVVARVEK